MPSPKTRRNISRIIPFGVIWLVFSTVYTLLEKGLIAGLNYYPSTGNPYNFSRNIIMTPVSALITGLFIGAIEILYLNKLLIQKSFTRKIIYKSVIYLLLILSFIILISVIGNSTELHASVFDQQVWKNVGAFFFHYAFLSVAAYMAIVIIVSQIYTEVSDNIGHEVLTNFFTGRYHTPKEEERVFMFLDMKSSTTIAESLGHVRYFNMLREYFSDMSEPIVKYSGEIYQYVGDEIVISWKIQKGLQNNNCIQCFFAMRSALNKQSRKYNKAFGILPEFKAGFHLGKVTTGEIGIIKKEIIFTGDVLNTAARIQALCNSFKVDILISGQLKERLSSTSAFSISHIGEQQLRGRGETVELFTLSLNTGTQYGSVE